MLFFHCSTQLFLWKRDFQPQASCIAYKFDYGGDQSDHYREKEMG